MFTSNVLNNKCFRKMKHARLWKNVILWAISRREISFIGAVRERSSKIRYCIIWRCLHLMFSTTNVSDKWNVRGFERMLSYEQYPEEKSRLWLSSFKKKLINLHGEQLDVTTNIYLKSCAYHPDSECCTFFHGNLSDPKSSEDTLLYLHVI